MLGDVLGLEEDPVMSDDPPKVYNSAENNVLGEIKYLSREISTHEPRESCERHLQQCFKCQCRTSGDILLYRGPF